MKIKPDHYAVLEKAVSTALNQKPWLDTEYQAAGFSPKQFRWDTLLRNTEIRIGDSVGMNCPDAVDPAIILPLYDYMDDTHIDSALRDIFKKCGFEYGASNDQGDAAPLVIVNGKQFTPSGNMIAEIVHRDQSSSVETKTTCIVCPNGQVIAEGLIALATKSPGEISVIDITGDEHSVSIENEIEMRLDDSDFIVRHSCYTVTTYDRVISDDDIDLGGSPEHEDGSWENASFTFDEIEGEARNHSFSEYGEDVIYSTDPSGTREFYEDGINRYHYMKIETVNDMPPSKEMIAALGKELGLTPSADLVQSTKAAPGMRM